MGTEELRECIEQSATLGISSCDVVSDPLVGQLERQQQTISALDEKNHRLEEELRVCKTELAMMMNVLCQKDVDREVLRKIPTMADQIQYLTDISLIKK